MNDRRRVPTSLSLLMVIMLIRTSHTALSPYIYDSSYAYATFSNADKTRTVQQCINYQQWQHVRVPDNTEFRVRFWDGDNLNSTSMCQRESGTLATDSIVPVDYRYQMHHACSQPPPETIYELSQVDRAEAAKAAGVLFLVERGMSIPRSQYHDYLYADFRDQSLDNTSTPVYYMYQNVFRDVMVWSSVPDHVFLNAQMSLSTVGVVDKDTSVTVSIVRPPTLPFECALLIVFMLALFAIIVGGHWSAERRYQLQQHEIETLRRRRRRREKRARRLLEQAQRAREEAEAVANGAVEQNGGLVTDRLSSGDVRLDLAIGNEVSPRVHKQNKRDKQSQKEPSATPFNWITLIIMVAMIVGMLVLAWLYRAVMVWIFIILFVLGSAAAMYSCVSALYRPLTCGQCRVCMSINDVTTSVLRREVLANFGVCRARPTFANVIIAVVSMSTAVFWCVYRNNVWAFALQDFLSLCFCINVIKTLRMPSLKSITALLVILLLYDLFMVFLTPFFTKNGCSIMVQVATGTDCILPSQSEGVPIAPVDADIPESIPILFRVPRLSDPMLPCYDMSVEMQYRPMILGMGDVILPGLLVGFAFGADRLLKLPWNMYGWMSVVSYAIGLIITFLVLVSTASAQPALIYLVPCVLIPVYILALCRHELGRLWSGQLSDDAELHLLPSGGGNGSFSDQQHDNEEDVLSDEDDK